MGWEGSGGGEGKRTGRREDNGEASSYLIHHEHPGHYVLYCEAFRDGRQLLCRPLSPWLLYKALVAGMVDKIDDNVHNNSNIS